MPRLILIAIVTAFLLSAAAILNGLPSSAFSPTTNLQSLAALAGQIDTRPHPGASLADQPQPAPSPTPIPATAADFLLPGSQPNSLHEKFLPTADCAVCHSNYGQKEVEPSFNWSGGMMAQSAVDPLFWAAVAVANQDVADAGTMCMRCHVPTAWLAGRAAADGSALNALDREGVSCHFCHRLVDPEYRPGISPSRDLTVTAAISPAVPFHGAAMYVVDPEDERRGPWDLKTNGWYKPDCAPAATCREGNPHRPLEWPLESDFHRQSALCGTCHDLLNPMFHGDATAGYAPDPLGVPLAPEQVAAAFPEQRTYTEWRLSQYATEAGMVAPQFRADGAVHSCQDCHMASAVDASAGADRGNPLPPVRCNNCPTTVVHPEVPVHDLTGANTWVPEALKVHPIFSRTVDAAALTAGVERAKRMLSRAATVTATLRGRALNVRVTNETGHKLPTGYPEGRQMWLAVTALDPRGRTVYASGAYDAGLGRIVPDADLQRFRVEQGYDEEWAATLGLSAGPSHHIALNNRVIFDNRIPPRGFTKSAFEAAGAAPAGATYSDGQYWFDARYALPASVAKVTVALMYQTTDRAYAEFLRDANHTTADGARLYALWEQTGRSAPVTMARVVIARVAYLPLVARAWRGNPRSGGPSAARPRSIEQSDGQTGDVAGVDRAVSVGVAALGAPDDRAAGRVSGQTAVTIEDLEHER